MKKSEILQELEDNVEQMEMIISEQKFTVDDAQRYLKRYYNIVRKMEDLEKSNIRLRGENKKLIEEINRIKNENKL